MPADDGKDVPQNEHELEIVLFCPPSLNLKLPHAETYRCGLPPRKHNSSCHHVIIISQSCHEPPLPTSVLHKGSYRSNDTNNQMFVNQSTVTFSERSKAWNLRSEPMYPAQHRLDIMRGVSFDL